MVTSHFYSLLFPPSALFWSSAFFILSREAHIYSVGAGLLTASLTLRACVDQLPHIVCPLEGMRWLRRVKIAIGLKFTKSFCSIAFFARCSWVFVSFGEVGCVSALPSLPRVEQLFCLIFDFFYVVFLWGSYFNVVSQRITKSQ